MMVVQSRLSDSRVSGENGYILKVELMVSSKIGE